MAKYNTSINNLLRNQPVTAPGSGTTYTALVTDRFIDITATGAFALSLPDPVASNNSGQIYTIKDVAGNAFTNNITITPASGTIDGAASLVLNANYVSATLFSDGTNYYVVSTTIVPTTFTWNQVSTASQTAVGGNGYYVSNATLTTITLPASPTAGQEIKVVGTPANTAFFKIAQNATQQIEFGNSATTVGTGGSLTGSAVGDSISLLCTTGGSAAVWTCTASIGNFLVT
jgi:hypothetical protein